MTKQDLLPFCQKPPFRPHFQQPFLVGAHTIATDGKVIIRVHEVLEGCEPLPENKSIPNVIDRWSKGDKAFPLPTTIPAASRIPCPKCSGSGVRRCNLQHDHECDKCEGAGEVEQRLPVEIGLAFRAVNIALLKMQPLRGLQFWPVAKQAVCRFTFDNGEGIIAEMKTPSEDDNA